MAKIYNFRFSQLVFSKKQIILNYSHKKTVVLLDNNGHHLKNNDEKAEAFAQHLHSAFQPNPEDDINNTLEVQNFRPAI